MTRIPGNHGNRDHFLPLPSLLAPRAAAAGPPPPLSLSPHWAACTCLALSQAEPCLPLLAAPFVGPRPPCPPFRSPETLPSSRQPTSGSECLPRGPRLPPRSSLHLASSSVSKLASLPSSLPAQTEVTRPCGPAALGRLLAAMQRAPALCLALYPAPPVALRTAPWDRDPCSPLASGRLTHACPGSPGEWGSQRRARLSHRGPAALVRLPGRAARGAPRGSPRSHGLVTPGQWSVGVGTMPSSGVEQEWRVGRTNSL